MTDDAGQLLLACSLNMLARVDSEYHVFKKPWTVEYLFTEVKCEAVVLSLWNTSCRGQRLQSEVNHVTKHKEKYKNLSEEDHTKESEALLAKLQNSCSGSC